MDQSSQPNLPSPGNTPTNSVVESQAVTSQDSFQYNQLTAQNQEQLDFILIRQKDNIIREINQGNLTVAIAKLKLVKELWVDCEYLYKYEELLTRINYLLERKLSRGQ